MTSDDKENKDGDLEESAGISEDSTEDFIDLEVEGDEPAFESNAGDDVSPVESLAAETVSGDMEGDFDQDLDVDITGDENIDFADEDDGPSDEDNGKLKKILAPALVLVVAAGIGGYIVMNPQILGGDGALPEPENPYVAQGVGQNAQSEFFETRPEDQSSQQAMDITEEDPFAAADEGFSESLPQPTVNQNEMPRPPVEDNEIEIVDVAEPEQAEFPSASETEAETETIAEPDPFGAAEITEQGSAPDSAPSEDPLQDLAEESGDLEDELAALNIFEEEAGAPEPEPLGSEDLMPVGGAGETNAESGFFADQPGAGQSVNEEPMQMAQADVFEVPQARAPEMPVETRLPETDLRAGAQGAASSPVNPSATIAPASDTYYDGTVPTGPMAGVGPRKVDPQMEPASQLVVVKKAHEANDMESLLVSANRALKLQRYESALDIFNRLYDKNSRDPRILMGLAVAQQNTGRVESAIRTYEQLLDRDPDNTNAMLNMLGLLRQQYPSVALRRLIDLHDKHPDNAGIAAQIGITQADLGHIDDAMRYLGMAASLEPDSAQHYYNMAIIADRSGQTAQAIKYYEQALELDAIYSSGRSISRETVYDRLATLRRR